jgi:hypothetical protein
VAFVARKVIAELVHYQTFDTSHMKKKGTADQRNLSGQKHPWRLANGDELGKGSAETREHAGERDGQSSCQSCGTAEAQRREVFGGSIQRGTDVLAELIASAEGVRCHRSSGGDRGPWRARTGGSRAS